MTTTTIAAAASGALVTDNSDYFSLATWVGAGVLAFGIIAAIIMAVTLKEDALLAFVPVIGCLFFGTPLICCGLIGADNGGMAVDDSRVEAAISERYRITSVEAVIDEGERGPTGAQLCEAVSTKSPEYIGVAEGQQIRFKAGSTNCTSDNPDITIIVTDTPGAALSADDLRERTTTEEP